MSKTCCPSEMTSTQFLSELVRLRNRIDSPYDEIIVPITTANQSLFANAIPVNMSILDLYIDGVRQNQSSGSIVRDYSISGRDINWTSVDFALNPSLTLTITVK